MILSWLIEFGTILWGTFLDVLPILGLIMFFQFFVLKQPIPHLRRVIVGSVYVVLGLALFLMGLEKALFPIGNTMAVQLSSPDFVADSDGKVQGWWSYYWVYIFAALIGFSTTIAEPSLIAVAIKAEEASAGTISTWGLRIAVALGVAVALTLGVFRIVTGTPLFMYILGAYVVVIIQTIFSPREIIPLAYDSGGVTTSTVTVPLVAALGLGLASTIPGRNPALDGFGLIALASLYPIIAVLGYAQFMEWKIRNKKRT